MKLSFSPTHIPTMPRPLKWFLASMLSLASIMMIAVLVCFLTITLGAFVLTATAPGQKWLSAQLNTLTAGNGYTVAIGRVHALGASQIALSHLVIYSGETPFLTADSIVITPALAGLLHGELRLDARVRTLLLHEIPNSNTPVSTPITGPLVPDAAMLAAMLDSLPVQRLVLDSLHINQLAMVDAKGTATMMLTPSLRILAEKTDGGLYVDAKFVTTGLLEQDAALESTLRGRLSLHPEDPAVIIDALDIIAASFSQKISGRLDLPRTPEDAAPLAFSLHAPLPGHAQIDLSALLIQHTGTIGIKDLVANGPGVKATGALEQTENTAWRGALDASISFNQLATFIPQLDTIPLKENLDVKLSFDGPTLNLGLARLRHDMADLRDVRLSTTPIENAPAGSRSISLSAKDSMSQSSLTASAHFMYDDSGIHWRIEKLDAILTASNAGKVSLKGGFDLKALDLTFNSVTLRPDRLKGALSPTTDMPPLRLDNMTLTASGSMSAPVITAKAQITPIQLPKGTPPLNINATGHSAGGMASLDAKINSKALKTGTLTVRQPLTLSFNPFTFELPNDGLDAKAALRGNLSALSGFLPVGLTLSGDTNLDISAKGSLLAPVSAGTLTVTGGRLRDSGSGVALQDIAVKGRFDNDAVVIDSMSARDSKRGRVTATGRLTLAPNSWPVEATLKMVDIDPFTRSAAVISTLPVIDGVLDADLKLSGAHNSYLLAGTVGSKKLDITLPATFSSSVPQLNIVEKKQQKQSSLPGLSALRLEISANMPRQIFVRGWGLDAEFGGKVALSGTAADPIANGSLQSLRGRYEEFGRKFTLARARLDFMGAIPPSPYLDIVAETKVDGLTAQVVLGGNAIQPKVTFTSTPALPQEDVLSHILFGKDRANISPTQAIQMAQTLQRFSGGGQGLDPLGKLRSGFGLDDLSVDSDEEGGTSIGAGKYLSDDVYLQVGGGDKGGEAKVQIELTPNVKVESEIGQDARAGGGLFWEWEY